MSVSHLLGRMAMACLLLGRTSIASEKVIDLEGTHSLVVWRSAEKGQVGPVTCVESRVLYSTFEREQAQKDIPANREHAAAPDEEGAAKPLLRTAFKCRSLTDGGLLWNATAESLGNRYQYPIGLPTISAASVFAGCVFLQTAAAQVVALDIEPLSPGKNRGPFRWEQNQNAQSADILWLRDFQADLKVVPRNVADVGAAVAAPLAIGGRVYCVTGNAGVYEDGEHYRRNPAAPAFVALSASDGSLLWQNNDPNAHCSFLQNGSPFLVSTDREPKTIGFPGGDGYIYILDAKTGATRTRLACFPASSTPWTKETRGTRNFFSIPPTILHPYILSCPGWTIETAGMAFPEHRSPVFAYKLLGDDSAQLSWTFDDNDFRGSMSPLFVHENEVFVLGFPDRLIVLDVTSGRKTRESRLPGRCVGHAGMTAWKDRLIVCLEDGIYVIANNAHLDTLAYLNPGEASSIYSQPSVEGGRLTVATASKLWSISLDALDKLLK